MKCVIFNADDFGASSGVNRGIVEAHTRGVVTSTSMMVTGAAVDEAVRMSTAHPDLAVGLHFDVWGEDTRDFDMDDLAAVRRELTDQLARFNDLMGRDPTHVDSHKHAHRSPGAMDIFQELVGPLDVPIRDDGRVAYIGGFYAQWEWKVTDLGHVSIDALTAILETETAEGWSEIGCHPGYRSADYESVYLLEREHEVETLTDPRVRGVLSENHIELKSYADYRQWALTS